MSSLSHLNEIFWFLIDPWIFMSLSLYYLPGTILRLIRAGDIRAIFSWPRLQSAWFGAFWAWAGPGVRQTGEQRVIPLLEGRVNNGKETEQPVMPPVNGIVLEIGAGSGMWVDVFAKMLSDTPTGEARQRRPSGKGVEKVYGIEPNAGSHAELRRRVKDAGLEGTYEVVPVGIESLSDPTKWDGKVEKGSVDCIVSILCLCSIPNPEENITELYKYLKKGGRWYAYEHVKITDRLGMRLYQAFVNLFWPHIIGGCELCRTTEKYLTEAGPWEKIDLAQPPTEPWYHTLPHVYGTLTK